MAGEQLTYGLDYMKNMHIEWNKIIIHVDFDHAWAEYYPVTLRRQ